MTALFIEVPWELIFISGDRISEVSNGKSFRYKVGFTRLIL